MEINFSVTCFAQTCEIKYLFQYLTPRDNTLTLFGPSMALAPEQVHVLQDITDVLGWTSFVLNTAVFIGYS